MAAAKRSRIYVIAGVNGAGKSSIGGATFREFGAEYYNPDEAASRMLGRATRIFLPRTPTAQPGTKASDCSDAPFLNAKILPLRLPSAPTRSRVCFRKRRHKVSIFMFGTLAWPMSNYTSIELKPVSTAAATPSQRERIERRFEQSRINLIDLLPHLTELRVHDNSADADPAIDKTPELKQLLHMKRGRN